MGMWITVNVSFKRDRFREQEFIFGAVIVKSSHVKIMKVFFFLAVF